MNNGSPKLCATILPCNPQILQCVREGGGKHQSKAAVTPQKVAGRCYVGGIDKDAARGIIKENVMTKGNVAIAKYSNQYFAAPETVEGGWIMRRDIKAVCLEIPIVNHLCNGGPQTYLCA